MRDASAVDIHSPLLGQHDEGGFGRVAGDTPGVDGRVVAEGHGEEGVHRQVRRAIVAAEN